MNRWDAFTTVCGHLRAGLLGGEPSRQHGEVWELLVEASSYHRVTPTLAWCLKKNPDVPAEAREYFDAILALNGKRNETLLAALARIIAACNAIGIEPVPLKGAARLAERDYPAPSLRFLGDLDVLIAAERAADAVTALRAIGFRANADDKPTLPYHHLPTMRHREGGGGVELHTDVLSGDSAKVIPTAWFLAGTRPAAFQDLRIRLADATCSVGHIIVHDQLLNYGYRRRKVELRQVLDVSVIRASHEGAIDWAELDHRFCAMGLGTVLATYLAITEALLGQPVPRLKCAPRSGAIRDLRRAVEATRWHRAALIMRNYMAARRRDPRGVLQLLDLHRWPGRIRLVMGAFKRRPPDW